MRIIYLGIDNGISGGLAWLDAEGNILTFAAMPAQDIGKKTKRKKQVRNVLDLRGFQSLYWQVKNHLETSHGPVEVRVVLERPNGSSNALAAKSMDGCYWGLKGMLAVMNPGKTRSIHPEGWQLPTLGRVPGETKACALALAQKLWQGVALQAPGSKSGKPHEGIVDALLIADWGRQHWDTPVEAKNIS